jgi:hypothetical protein
MATINGTIQGCTLQYKSWSGDGGSSKPCRETWLMTLSFGAYTGSTDSANVSAVVGTINNKARDGKTRTFVVATPAGAGYDTARQAVYLVGASGQAITSLSSDAAAGNLGDVGATELTSATASQGVQWLVTVDVNNL